MLAATDKVTPDMSRTPVLVLVSLLFTAIAHAESPPDCATPAATGDGWHVSEPEAQHLNAAMICAATKQLEKLESAKAHGVVIVRNGVIVHEAYFAGPDRRWPQEHWQEPLENTAHDISTRHDIQSITKSVVALLFAIYSP